MGFVKDGNRCCSVNSREEGWFGEHEGERSVEEPVQVSHLCQGPHSSLGQLDQVQFRLDEILEQGLFQVRGNASF